MDSILGFFGEYRFLSNFYVPCEIKYRGIIFPSSEHAFQADKADNDQMRQYIADLPSPRAAQRAGRKVDLPT